MHIFLELTLVWSVFAPILFVKMKFSINFEFWYQMKAMTIRNMLIKRREKKKTLSVSIYYTHSTLIEKKNKRMIIL